MNKPLLRGSSIGILGGGQLGQMLSMAAARLGFKTHIFEPSSNPPASNVSSKFTQSKYDDYDALKKFASSVDVVTYEFENIPTGALDIIETQCEIFPSRDQKDLILEGFVNFTSEFSVIGSRSQDGQISCFDPGENVHQEGILRTTTVPADITNQQKTEAVLITAKILESLNYVGVIGVEFFLEKGSLVINEFAPRVHNSGHWTQNG